MQPHTPEDLIDATVDGSVLVITINRPAKRNAITQDMYRTINDSLSSTWNRPELGAVVITGCGESFTAGNDLADLSSGGELEESNRFLEILGDDRRSIGRLPVSAASATNVPLGRGPRVGGPAKAWAMCSHCSAGAPMQTISVSSTARRCVTT